jgi:hypothetical protein
VIRLLETPIAIWPAPLRSVEPLNHPDYGLDSDKIILGNSGATFGERTATQIPAVNNDCSDLLTPMSITKAVRKELQVCEVAHWKVEILSLVHDPNYSVHGILVASLSRS